MNSQIISLGTVNRKFERWTVKILDKIGDTISNGIRKFRILKPVRAVILADSVSFDAITSKLECERQVAQVGYDAYGRIREMSPSEIESFYRDEEKVRKDLDLAFWFCPDHKYRGIGPVDLDPDDGYIFMCVDEVKSFAECVEKSFNEKIKGGTLRSIFKLVLLHEFCHHATLVNLTRRLTRFAKENEDENFTEGLANTILHHLVTSQERRLLAELVSYQGTPYRYYYVMRGADVGKLLDLLVNKRDLLSSLREFAALVGGRLNLNGNTMRVGSSEGWLMDWSNKGGNVVAGESIEILGLFNKGYFIAPKIRHLVGRFPSRTKILTNEITNAHDYARLPDNIIIVPKERCNLESLIRDFQWSSEQEDIPKDVASLAKSIESLL